MVAEPALVEAAELNRVGRLPIVVEAIANIPEARIGATHRVAIEKCATVGSGFQGRDLIFRRRVA